MEGLEVVVCRIDRTCIHGSSSIYLWGHAAILWFYVRTRERVCADVEVNFPRTLASLVVMLWHINTGKVSSPYFFGLNLKYFLLVIILRIELLTELLAHAEADAWLDEHLLVDIDVTC